MASTRNNLVTNIISSRWFKDLRALVRRVTNTYAYANHTSLIAKIHCALHLPVREHEAKVNVHKPPLIIYQDIAIVSVFDLHREGRGAYEERHGVWRIG